eukprot:TRINITY_DN9384_c0_g1_i2.p1 TRINITY_DN9384_c0_g1~~TRINITY_DN9384_c0_g1_i2.p1  ORF type:complete len:922 (-),score=165.23 TRINITY_DN9384_c0_g1_i2:86-2851(-)
MGANDNLFQELILQLQTEHSKVLAELADLRRQTEGSRPGNGSIACEKTGNEVKVLVQSDGSPCPLRAAVQEPPGIPTVLEPEVPGKVQEIVEDAAPEQSSGASVRKSKVSFGVFMEEDPAPKQSGGASVGKSKISFSDSMVEDPAPKQSIGASVGKSKISFSDSMVEDAAPEQSGGACVAKSMVSFSNSMVEEQSDRASLGKSRVSFGNSMVSFGTSMVSFGGEDEEIDELREPKEKDYKNSLRLPKRYSVQSTGSMQSFSHWHPDTELEGSGVAGASSGGEPGYQSLHIFNDPVRMAKHLLGLWAEITKQQRAIVTFNLHPRWKFKDDTANPNLSTFNGRHRKSLDFRQVAQARSGMSPSTRFHKFVVQPTSHKRGAWELLGMLLLVYDLAVLPLSAFGLPASEALQVMEWVTLLFWTMDMPASCLTGYAAGGEVIMEPRLILRRYLTTWFWIDSIIVVPDWLFIILELSSGTDSSFDGGRLLRGLRMFRSARLLRLMKAARFLERLKDIINSESMLVALNVSKLLVSLLCISHLLASLWWIIGDWGMREGIPNWVESNNMVSQSLPYRYTTAMHWSLTQFTPASIDIQPHNAMERCFALCLLLLGLVIFSSFISAITQNMMALASLQDAREKQMWLLRKYLRQHAVPRELSFRILRYVDYHMQQAARHVPEAKVGLLSMLSTSLRSELRFIVSFSCLQAHPLYDKMGAASDIMHRLVVDALAESQLAAGDVGISFGAPASEAICLESGSLSYQRPTGDDEATSVNPGDWLVEACLWTDWCHLGDAMASQESKIVSITAGQFAQLVSKHEASMKLASVYSTEFLQMISRLMRKDLSDLLSSSQSYRLFSRFTEALREEHLEKDLPTRNVSEPTPWSLGSVLATMTGHGRKKEKGDLVEVVPAPPSQMSEAEESCGSEQET